MIRSKRQFIYGSVSINVQLVKGNSAGTVTTFYVSIHTPSTARDESEFP
jgi:xyloglucan:xyloglucosyl transferase